MKSRNPLRGNGFRFCIFLITEGQTLLHCFQGEENAAEDEAQRATAAESRVQVFAEGTLPQAGFTPAVVMK